MLRFYASTGHVGYIDRLASAISPNVVEITLIDALRELHSVLGTSIVVKGVSCRYSRDEKAYLCEDSETQARCCEYEVLEDRYLVRETRGQREVYSVREGIPERMWIYGTMIKVLESTPIVESIKNRIIMCYRCPSMPSKEETEKFIEAIHSKCWDVLRRVVAMSLIREEKKGG